MRRRKSIGRMGTVAKRSCGRATGSWCLLLSRKRRVQSAMMSEWRPVGVRRYARKVLLLLKRSLWRRSKMTNMVSIEINRTTQSIHHRAISGAGKGQSLVQRLNLVIAVSFDASLGRFSTIKPRTKWIYNVHGIVLMM